MAFAIEDNIRRQQVSRTYTIQKRLQQAAPIIRDTTEASIHFIILWTAVFWYYFFSGLYMLIWRRLPKGWNRLEKKHVVSVIGNMSDYLPQKRQQKSYGRVVDLDRPQTSVDLLRS